MLHDMEIRSGRITPPNISSFNLVLWAFSYALFLWMFTGDEKPNAIDFIYTACFLSTLIIPTILNFYVFIPSFLKREKYLIYIIIFILNCLVFTILNEWFFDYFVDYIFPEYYFISYHSSIALFTIFIAFLASTTLIKLSLDWFYINRKENYDLKVRNQQMQLQLSTLRSQINPHFLFNSLNVIYSLALEKRAETKDAIVQLSHILRYVIYDSNTELVFIEDEITLLKNYIEFHQFRHKKDNNVNFFHQVDNNKYKIYPMLLLPLVENSFKHGIKGDIANTYIKIKLMLNSGIFTFEIENNSPKHPVIEKGYSGVGLNNIKKNLEIVYPNNHSFKIVKSENKFKVILELY
ncbi:sensor histidine kinase [Aegicerativicinus sediminis]|uniref:sensor histidine kinase n=1 Tax=Aegicerativicinus sediminis TaxID=2893202 RepID=UPI001E3FD0E5|nr:sensor histidine kinase [Aegicerativicinus sediminis]